MDRRLPRPDWTQRARDHAARADAATADHLGRRAAGQAHPVEDFLFTYYPFRPGALRRWHPGPGVVLAAAAADERARWRHYTTTGEDVRLDVTAYLRERGSAVRFVRELLTRTAQRPGAFTCFGLHEWAMVYRREPAAIRHSRWPLRLGSAGTDAVVEAADVRCTHFDAFRFFTPAARPRNAVTPTRQSRSELEQPGCLHAGMDLYKWAMKLSPGVPGELVLDCFELARELRTLDMRASPYDLGPLGCEPIPIETAEGRAAYVRAQRQYAVRAQALRARLISVCDALLGSGEPQAAAGYRSRPPFLPSAP